MGVKQYQDYTLYINVDRGELRGRHLTDEQLCADWNHEFPDAVLFTLDHVKGVRRDYQKGTVGGSKHRVRAADGAVSAAPLPRPGLENREAGGKLPACKGGRMTERQRQFDARTGGCS